jgi:hypothetical protein
VPVEPISMMSRSCAAALLALSLVLPGQSPAHAAKRAFVLGIDAYDKVPKLSKAVNDGKAVATLLQELQFEVTSLSNANKSAFQQGWGDFLNSLKEGDTTLFYFAGHGVQLEGLNYLLVKDTSDGAKGDEAIRSENIGFHDLLTQVEARKPKISLYILDACRDNPFGGKAKGKALGQARGLARLESVFGTFVMYSAGPDEQALDALSPKDKEPNSVYTRRLLPLLRDKELSLVDVAKRIQVQVEEDARTKSGHQQRPAYFDGILGHYNAATDTIGSNSLLFTSQEEWTRNPRVMWIDYRSQWDVDCNTLTPPRITVVTAPKYGRIVTRHAGFTASRPSTIDSNPNRCLNTQQRGWGIYYVMDEEHRDKKAVESVRLKVNYFLAPKKPTLTIDYSIDPATRTRTFAHVK